MTLRQVVWFLAAHVALITIAIWFNLSVLCAGDAKYNGGCGGFGVYIPLWLIFLAPLALAPILLERWRKTEPPPTRRLVAYLMTTLVVAEIGFLVIEKFPVLLALEAAVILVAVIARWRMTTRTQSAASS
jgi:hypothetical protein